MEFPVLPRHATFIFESVFDTQSHRLSNEAVAQWCILCVCAIAHDCVLSANSQRHDCVPSANTRLRAPLSSATRAPHSRGTRA